MNISFYNAASALKAYQKNIEQVSHNLANISTVGYKSGQSQFADLVYTQMDVNQRDTEMLRGHGVKVASVSTNFKQGPLQTTEQPLDFAILGDGFFAKGTPEGIVYSRNGAFRVGTTDEGNYLVYSDGSFVLDRNFEVMKLDYDANGSIQVNELIEKIGIFNFDNPQGLIKINETSFLPSEISKEAVVVANGSVSLIQGALELSNVDMAEGMVALIEGQKAFQLNSRVIQASDQLEEIINNLR